MEVKALYQVTITEAIQPHVPRVIHRGRVFTKESGEGEAASYPLPLTKAEARALEEEGWAVEPVAQAAAPPIPLRPSRAESPASAPETGGAA